MKIRFKHAALLALLSTASLAYAQTAGGGTGTGTGTTGTGTTGTGTGAMGTGTGTDTGTTGSGTGTTGSGTSTTGTNTGTSTDVSGDATETENGGSTSIWSAPILNASARSKIAAGGDLILGFVVGQPTQTMGAGEMDNSGNAGDDGDGIDDMGQNQSPAVHQVLIRAVGPGLSTFNLTGLARPQISLYRNNQLIATNSGGWGSWDVNANMADGTGSGTGTGTGSGTGTGGTGTGTGTGTGGTGTGTGGTGTGTDGSGTGSGFGSFSYYGTGTPLNTTFSQVGAFPLTSGSADAAISAGLPAGAYSIVISGGDAADAGDVLVEIYVVQ